MPGKNPVYSAAEPQSQESSVFNEFPTESLQQQVPATLEGADSNVEDGVSAQEQKASSSADEFNESPTGSLQEPDAAPVEGADSTGEVRVSAQPDMGLSDILEKFRLKERTCLPPGKRWEVWKLAVHGEAQNRPAGFALSEQHHPIYSQCCLKAADGAVPKNVVDQIHVDLPRTGLPLNDARQEQLGWILKAFCVSREGEGSNQGSLAYVQGMAQFAGLLFCVSNYNEEETFQMFSCLMNDYKFEKIYAEGFPLVRRWQDEHAKHISNDMKELNDALMQRMETLHDADALADYYCCKWFMTLFVACLPYPLVLAIMDVVVCNLDQAENEPSILRDVSISLLDLVSPALLNPNMDDAGIKDAFTNTMSADDFLNKLLEAQLKSTQAVRTNDALAQKCSEPVWRVLAHGFAGFVAGSMREKQKNEKRKDEQCSQVSLDPQHAPSHKGEVPDNFVKGLVLGILAGSLASTTAIYAGPAAWMAWKPLASSAAASASAVLSASTVQHALVPAELVGVLYLDALRERAAAPFLELGQDLAEAMSFDKLRERAAAPFLEIGQDLIDALGWHGLGERAAAPFLELGQDLVEAVGSRLHIERRQEDMLIHRDRNGEAV